MEVTVDEIEVNVGDIVKIDDDFYIVNSLISCVEYDWKRGEYYLHKLSGAGYFSYPTSLCQLTLKIKEANGIIYPKNQFKVKLELH